MTQAMSAAGVEKSIVEGVLEALSDKHAQLDVNLQGMSIKFPSIGMSMEFNGLVTVTAHFRDMTADEKKASANKNVTLMSRS